MKKPVKKKPVTPDLAVLSGELAMLERDYAQIRETLGLMLGLIGSLQKSCAKITDQVASLKRP